MKKKILGGIAILAIAAVAAFNVNFNTQSNDLSAVSLANVEALAGELSGGNTVDCYSESDYKSGSTYYDCGDCKKQENAEGKGNKRTCITA